MSGFDSFLANKALISRLERDIRSKRLAHAYIIEGVDGSGKKTLAKLIAAAMSCESDGDDKPCMECVTCDKIMRSQSPDVVYIEAEKDKVQLGVDIIRKLINESSFAPNDLTHKFCIFPAADSMNIQAQNALLKLLEEPPEHIVFLLLCKSADSLLPTIRSRAPTLRLELLDDKTIAEHLKSTSPSARELSQSDPDAFTLAVRMSGGSLGRAIELCDPESAKRALESHKLAEKYIELLAARRELPFYEFAARLPIKQRPELELVYTLLCEAVRDLIAAKLAGNFRPLFFGTKEKAVSTASPFAIAKLLKLFDLFEESRRSLGNNVNLSLSQTRTAMHALAILASRSITA